MKGEYVMYYVLGLWNGIWSDMFIEIIFMCYGYGFGGIFGIILKFEVFKIWVFSLYICSCLE